MKIIIPAIIKIIFLSYIINLLPFSTAFADEAANQTSEAQLGHGAALSSYANQLQNQNSDETKNSLSLDLSEQAKNDKLSSKEAEIEKNLKLAINAAVVGPAKVKLIDQAVLNLPEDYLFIPKKEAAVLMKSLGNDADDDLKGLILPANWRQSFWLISIRFDGSGYIQDDEAKSWKADELLKSLTEGTEDMNKERVSQGFPALHIVKWVSAPLYNDVTHKLTWSMLAKTDEGDNIVNYRMHALGREGYFSLTVVGSDEAIRANQGDATKILEALQYDNGKRYTDYVKSTDKIAKYGIAALVTGIAAKKLGLLALAGVFLIKIWKIIAVSCILFWKRIKNFF